MPRHVKMYVIIHLGLARLSCSGNINSVQTKTIPTIIPMMSLLDKHGFIDLSGILQAAKCQATSSERKAVTNPSTMYAILWKVLIDTIVSNILTEIMKVHGSLCN